MSLRRNNIRRILVEETKGRWDTETKALSRKQKGLFKLAEHMLRERHAEVIADKKRMEDESGGKKFPEHLYQENYDDFILDIKSKFPKYGYYHHLGIMQNLGYFEKYVIPPMTGVKLLTEYILNYQNAGEQQRIDVVPKDELWDYVKEQYFDCSREFFEHIWDEVLVDRRNYWNEGIKDRMWEELQPELEERMEDEEWQEENGIEFESLRNEEMYFHSYWHYPIQNFGWDEMQLCEYYREYITPKGI
jgi:hypothetical protein